MSRKREAQREAKRELARQLGVTKDAVPEELRAHARVTEPELAASLDVAAAKRGLLAKKRPLVVHVGLYVVDAAGARVARTARFEGTIARAPSQLALSPAARIDREPVRYTRPGHFVALAVALEGAEEDAHAAIAAGLVDLDTLTLALDDAFVPVGDRAVAKVEKARAVQVAHGGGAMIPAQGIAYGASALVSLAAAHRVHTTVRLPLVSADGKLDAALLLELRL